jgi:hypothetical protein
MRAINTTCWQPGKSQIALLTQPFVPTSLVPRFVVNGRTTCAQMTPTFARVTGRRASARRSAGSQIASLTDQIPLRSFLALF